MNMAEGCVVDMMRRLKESNPTMGPEGLLYYAEIALEKCSKQERSQAKKILGLAKDAGNNELAILIMSKYGY